MNDSLLTTVCLRYRPADVTAAVVYLSYLYMGLPRVDMALLETDTAVVAGKAASTTCSVSFVPVGLASDSSGFVW